MVRIPSLLIYYLWLLERLNIFHMFTGNFYFFSCSAYSCHIHVYRTCTHILHITLLCTFLFSCLHSLPIKHINNLVCMVLSKYIFIHIYGDTYILQLFWILVYFINIESYNTDFSASYLSRLIIMGIFSSDCIAQIFLFIGWVVFHMEIPYVIRLSC